MADKTKIEWTDATWNIITGCSIASPGCTNCYAMKLAGSGRAISQHPSRVGLTKPSKAGPVWTGEVRFNEAWLEQPLHWKRPRKIFVCAHGDLFHEDVPDEWIDRVFAVMALCPQHQFQVLTKRSARMRKYVKKSCGRIADTIIKFRRERGDNDPIVPLPHIRPGATWWPLPNVWLGVSVEDQARADERIPDLLATPAAIRWLSCEPLLGRVDLTRIAYPDIKYETGIHYADCLRGGMWAAKHLGFFGRPAQPDEEQGNFVNHSDLESIDWIVVGGESGPGARPMHPDWARSLRDQCAEAGVAFNMKQWGSWRAIYDRDREDPDWRRCSTIFSQNPKGRWLNLDGGHGFHGERVHFVIPAGKQTAGRLLDGVEHNGFPGEVA